LSRSAQSPESIPPAPEFDLRQIFARYPAVCRPDLTSRPESAAGFSGASVWKVESPGGTCALRATSASSIDRERLAGLHGLIAHVRGLGVTQVAVPIASLDGATFFESQGQIWQLEPWMPGSADFAVNPSEPRLRAALKCLAHWHRAAASFVARNIETRWFLTSASARSPGLAERIGQIARWTAPECAMLRSRLAVLEWKEIEEPAREILDAFVRVAPRVAISLKIGIDAEVPLQPCLRDIWHDHVLFTGDIVTGLVDPHAARSDSVATDLARLLGTLVGDELGRWDSGLAVYQEVRPLSTAELAMIELFDQSGVLLSGMTWLDWILLQGRDFRNREGVLVRLRSIIGRLRILVSRW
jgi:Ser/Thr protein kinase RdoA (MazF antagonist)